MRESSWPAGGQGKERNMTARVIHGQHKPPYTTTGGRRQTVKRRKRTTLEAKPGNQTRLDLSLKDNALCERQRWRTELEIKRVRESEFARYEVTTMCDNPNLN